MIIEKMKSEKELKDICSQVRRDILRMVHSAKSGHPGGALGCVEYLVVLYNNIMENNPKNFTMDGKGEDLFFLSNGHISAVWYSVLARCGYFEPKELATHRKLNSRLQGHPATIEHLPGIRMASGSLGQGLSCAIGAAITKKLNKENKLVFCLMGDGEIQEGQVWEAATYAAAKKVDNLIATIDCNGRQLDGDVAEIMPMFDLKRKFEAFNFDVLEMNGNNLAEVVSTLENAKTRTGKGKPIMILMKTEMGNGVDFMMGSHKWHGIAPNDEQLAQALAQNAETLGDY